MDLGLRGRVVLVTGGSGEIGRAVALAVAAEGARVAITYYSSRANAEAVVAEIAAAGGTALHQEMDLAAEDSIYAAVRSVARQWGTVDVLVNNAAARNWFGFRPEPADFARWEKTLRASLTGAFMCCAACIPYMKEARWGRIVNVSSALASRGLSGSAHYTAAKAGLLGLTKTLARELGREGILVNAVAPGLVLTSVYQARLPAIIERFRAENPLGRPAYPDDVARAVLFLASDWNTYVNGETIELTGGG